MKQALLSRSLLFLLSMLLTASIVLSFLFDEYSFYTGMGSDTAIAPQDSGIAVSYHINGSTYLYTADMDGSHAARVTNADSAEETNPAFSPDGKDLLFLDETREKIQSLFTIQLGDSEPNRLTGDELHIRDAVFSPDGTTIYAIGIAAEDWMAENSTSSGGFDIYAIERGSGEIDKVTNNDYFIMSHLSISPFGDYLFFNITEENEEEIHTYPLSEKSDIPASYKQFPTGIYGAVLAPDGQQVAYSAITNAAAEETNQYDLFLFNNETGQSERLTANSSNVESPAFYHESNQMMYVEDENWPGQPESYKLRSMDLADNEVTTIDLDVPDSPQQRWLSSIALFVMNPSTTVVLYALLGAFIVFKLRRFPKAVFLPACVSALLSAAAYAMNYFYTWTYQYIVMALGPPAFNLLLCAGILWLIALASRKIPV